MTIDQFRERLATGEPIVGGSDLHRKFHKYSQEALRITAEINGSYHTPEELRRLLSELWAIDVPESFGMDIPRTGVRRRAPKVTPQPPFLCAHCAPVSPFHRWTSPSGRFFAFRWEGLPISGGGRRVLCL